MTGIVAVYILGILTGVLGLLSCQERRRVKRRMGYPRRDR